jgi:predicted transcriptional regulator
MSHTENILISVDYTYVLKMKLGIKTAELRRRRPRIKPGTRVWIYSKLPRGHVELVATAEDVVAASPRKLWNLYEERLAVTPSEFKAYLHGVEFACAILLGNIQPLQPAVNLNALRRVSENFQPPQFFKRLVPRCPELRRLGSSFGSD